MLIQCTKSLLDQLGIKNSELHPSEGHEQFPNSFMAWHANFVVLIGTMEYMNFDAFEICQERFVSLEEIFPTYGEVVYEYDFGDSWEHTITLENVVKSNEFCATLVEGIGERPPEDVGGEGGYVEYQRIMADVNDPEHEDMNLWADSQKERNISLEKINHRLKQVIKGYHYSHFL